MTISEYSQWFFREPVYRIVLFILYFIDVISNVLRYTNCLSDKKKFNAKKQEELAVNKLNKKGILNAGTFDDTSHIRNMNVVLPDLWNDWYIYGRLFPSMFIQPSLERKRMVEIVYNNLKKNKIIKNNSKTNHDSNDIELSIPTIFIVGMPRTGSTFLHKILALDNTTYSPKQWELKFPITVDSCINMQEKHEGKERRDVSKKYTSTPTSRIHETTEVNKWTYKIMPRLTKIHNVSAFDPDECVIGFVDCAFPEYYLWGCRNMQNSYKYYLQSDMEEQYMNYKKQLIVSLHDASTPISKKENLRQDLNETSHLVLKSPHHTCKLKTISNVFPNSIFVWLHRPLENVVASTCSMNETLNDYSDVKYEAREALGQRTLKRLAEVMEIGMKERGEILRHNKNSSKFIDIYYKDLIKDPIKVVQNLYKQCGKKNCSEEYIERLKTYLKDDAERRKQRASSKRNISANKNIKSHKYSLHDFSITHEDINTAFESYRKKFNV